MQCLSGFIVLLFCTMSLAQEFNLGGSFPSTADGMGSLPRMDGLTPNPWNDSLSPDFQGDGNWMPDTTDLFIPNELNPPPLAPNPIDLITENPEGLSLPDPNGSDDIPFTPPPFAFDVMTQLEASGLIDLEDVEPFILPEDFVVEEIKTCSTLPKLTALDYVSGLNGNDLTEDRARQYHWLWAAKRKCAKATPSTTITVQMEDLRLLNPEDPRCIYMNTDDYINDLEMADSDDDAIVIEALYGYLFLCD